MTSELLQTKMRAPVTRTALVPRPRLFACLAHSREGRLTVVSAGAGCGKTTLVSEWLRNARLPFAWLNLDDGDNDPARFTAYLIATLQGIDATFGQAAQAALHSLPPSTPEAVATSLLNDVASTARPFVLVLDDYHLIHSLPIHHQLAFLVEHLPEQMHLIVISREDPPLPLARLRVSNQALEIRQGDLMFSVAETADFLRRVMRLDLSSADVATLHRRTEGWVAGLQLAGLSLRDCEDRHHFVQSFAGSHRYVLDYLMEEVLQRQVADVQDFLLRTSVLDRFCAPLCDWIAERNDSARLLRDLEQTNLFTVPLDEERHWFRFHHLFADLLRHRLQTSGEHDLEGLHRRASEWYDAKGFDAEAVHHALAARDWGRAAALIGKAYPALLRRGEVATLIGWFRRLPEAVVQASPELCQGYAWPLLLVGQLQAAESLLDLAESQAEEDSRLVGGIAAARAYLARARGDGPRMVALSERALSLLPESDASSRGILAANLGLAYWHGGQLARAEATLRPVTVGYLYRLPSFFTWYTPWVICASRWLA